MARGARVERLLIEAMAKQLPPSASTLQLVDVHGRAGQVLREVRPDIEVIYSPTEYSDWALEAESADAVAAYDCEPDAALLESALRVLRPGGRLIIMDSKHDPDEGYVRTLEAAQYTRILVEMGAECPLPVGVMMRGEKAHTEARTTERIKQVANRDNTQRSSRYVYLLVHQTPHKPVWRMKPSDRIVWEAVGVAGEDEVVALTFSSLPKAVEFMQPAVMAGHITNVNKIAKFKWDVAKNLPFAMMLNPSDEIFDTHQVAMFEIDHQLAEAPDE
ncbi:MAG: hypothetical protein J0L63_03480 [Anaerolineae bacterium]|nr:hypothetical protein [Anaerolineae bacterium]